MHSEDSAMHAVTEDHMLLDAHLFELSMTTNVHHQYFYKLTIVLTCLIKLSTLMKRTLENLDKIIECWLPFLPHQPEVCFIQILTTKMNFAVIWFFRNNLFQRHNARLLRHSL